MKHNISSLIKPVIQLVERRSEKAGLPPGEPVFVGEKKVKEVRINIIDYDAKSSEEKYIEDVRECFPYKESPRVTWINVIGLHEIAIVDNLSKNFGLHPLTVEDILNTHQRPKLEVFEDYIFIAIKMIYLEYESITLEIENLSIVLGENFVLTFQEKPGDVFNPIRTRINQRGRISKQGADYLAYALIDSIVDNYFMILENIDERIEDIEDKLITNPKTEELQEIYTLKREMITIRRAVWPLRELVNRFMRSESDLIKDSTQLYLKDLYDHTIQIIDTLETHRDVVAGMLEIYLSSVSNRLNDIMKFLTIFATIFIPLTFITGIYGMNFKHMPELEWRWGYFGALSIMAAVGISLLVYFKRKRWL